jgi:hypothetical protein
MGVRRRRSFREIRRFNVTDQEGNPHIIVERVVVLNEVGVGGKIVESQQGASTFYSATSGDVVMRTSDKSFVGKDRNCQFLIHSSE